jgi:hypothetical protein
MASSNDTVSVAYTKFSHLMMDNPWEKTSTSSVYVQTRRSAMAGTSSNVIISVAHIQNFSHSKSEILQSEVMGSGNWAFPWSGTN